MFHALDTVEPEELQTRWDRIRGLLTRHAPEAQGLLVLSRTNIFWCSGHPANGMLWLPLEGEPVLVVRKGIERARMESPLRRIHFGRSFKDLPGLMSNLGYFLPECAAVEFSGLSWAMGRKLETRLQSWKLADGDAILERARSVKTQAELATMRLAGERHRLCMEHGIPGCIRPGMSEREIGLAAWEEFFREGSQGIVRMSGFGEELLLGHVSAGDSGNYPSTLDAPVGLRGQHPSAPLLGYAGKTWQQGEILILDTVFFLNGYHTDKTQLFFAGRGDDLPSQARSAHAFCMELQRSAGEMLRPGVTPAEVYEHCRGEARRRGFEEGFMGLGGNKVPFVGHGIGLFLDEYPPLAEKFSEPLQEDMVLALEPKIGLPQMGMVGVENTFRVTPRGGESLTGGSGELIPLQ